VPSQPTFKRGLCSIGVGEMNLQLHVEIGLGRISCDRDPGQESQKILRSHVKNASSFCVLSGCACSVTFASSYLHRQGVEVSDMD
jgi:hypothetical protein